MILGNVVRKMTSSIQKHGIPGALYKVYKQLVFQYYSGKLGLRTQPSPSKELRVHWQEAGEGVAGNYTGLRIHIIILADRDAEKLDRCVKSIIRTTDFENCKMTVFIPNDVHTSYEFSEGNTISFNRENGPSSAVNSAVSDQDSEYIVLLNDNVETVGGAWMEELVSQSNVPGTGIVSGFSLIAQTGGSLLSHSHKVHSLLAQIGSCLMLRRDIFLACHGLNRYYVTSYAFLDLCLRIDDMNRTMRFSSRAIIRYQQAVQTPFTDQVDKSLFINALEVRRNVGLYNTVLQEV